MKLLLSYQLIMMYFNISEGEKREKTRISLFLARMITLFLFYGERCFFVFLALFSQSWSTQFCIFKNAFYSNSHLTIYPYVVIAPVPRRRFLRVVIKDRCLVSVKVPSVLAHRRGTHGSIWCHQGAYETSKSLPGLDRAQHARTTRRGEMSSPP